MAYDEHLAQRVRKLLTKQPGVTERKMFGGIAFMVQGNMCCGVHKADLIVRVGPQQYEQALAEPGARPMDITGRPLKGFVFADASACRNGKTLARWVKRGLGFATALPAK